MVRGYFSRLNAQSKRWKIIKEDEVLHKRHLINAKKYRDKNCNKINEDLKKYKRELTKISREIGNCTRCLKPKEKDKYRMCIKCREIMRNKYIKKVK